MSLCRGGEAVKTPLLACFADCLVDPEAFGRSQKLRSPLIADGQGGDGEDGGCPAMLERLAEARLCPGQQLGLEWVNGLPVKHESASEAWGGSGGTVA